MANPLHARARETSNASSWTSCASRPAERIAVRATRDVHAITGSIALRHTRVSWGEIASSSPVAGRPHRVAEPPPRGKIAFPTGVRVVSPYCILRGSLYLPPSTDPFPHE